MILSDLLAHSQPNACTLVLRSGVETLKDIKYLISILLIKPYPVINELNFAGIY